MSVIYMVTCIRLRTILCLHLRSPDQLKKDEILKKLNEKVKH